MKIDSDKLIINTGEVDAVGGAKPEPEERPVIRSMGTGVKVGVHNGHQIQQNGVGLMDASINSHDTAGEFFKRATPCQGCIHFRPDKWQTQLQRWKDSTDPVDRAELDRARAMFLGLSTQDVAAMIAGGLNPDDQLMQLGVCMGYTKFWMDMGKKLGEAFTVVSPLSACPATYPDGKTPLPKLYKANPNALINKIRDDAMLKADGKKL